MALELADGSSLIIGTNAGVLAHDGEVVNALVQKFFSLPSKAKNGPS